MKRASKMAMSRAVLVAVGLSAGLFTSAHGQDTVSVQEESSPPTEEAKASFASIEGSTVVFEELSETPQDVRLVPLTSDGKAGWNDELLATGCEINPIVIARNLVAEEGQGSRSIVVDTKMPIGLYRFQARESGINSQWVDVGAPFWFVQSPISIITPCDEQAELSMDLVPLRQAQRNRTMRATVPLSVPGKRFQGLVVSPSGLVITSEIALGGSKEVVGVFGPGAHPYGQGELRVKYQVRRDLDVSPAAILEPIPGPFTPETFPIFASIVDASMTNAGFDEFLRPLAQLYGTHRGVQERVPLALSRGHMERVQLDYSPLTEQDIGGPWFDDAGWVWALELGNGQVIWSDDLVDALAPATEKISKNEVQR